MTDHLSPTGARRARRGATGRWGRRVAIGAAVLLLATACTDSSEPSDDSKPGPSDGDELITKVAVDPAPNSEHIPILSIETAEPTTVTVTADGEGHEVVTPPSTSGTAHEVPVLGLRTDRTYDLSITAKRSDGSVERSAKAAEYTTPPLPDEFPELKVTSDAKRVAPGITLIPLISGDSGALKDPDPTAKPSPLATGRLVGLDQSGEVVWYYESELQVISVEPTPRGTLMLGIDEGTVLNLDGTLREIDLLGNTLGQWSTKIGDSSGRALPEPSEGDEPVVSVDVDSMHHDAHELPNGNIIALSTELIEVDQQTGRTLCPANPAKYLISDVVVEFERSGKVVGRWPVAEGYDPETRPGSDLCPPAPDTRAADGWMYPEVTDERDWTHANAVTLDEANNTLIVSLRNIDGVIGLRYQADADGPAGERLWDLGPDGDLAMQGDGLFPYHQHGPDLRPDGTIVVFDDGNLRPGTTDAGGTEPSFSRAVIYDVDPAARTVRQVWEHRDENPWGGPMFVPFLGDADPLENGNVLIVYGVFADADRRPHARIIEVEPDIEGGGAGDEVVLDVIVGEEEGAGWVAYHAAKLPSLYPAS